MRCLGGQGGLLGGIDFVCSHIFFLFYISGGHFIWQLFAVCVLQVLQICGFLLSATRHANFFFHYCLLFLKTPRGYTLQ